MTNLLKDLLGTKTAMSIQVIFLQEEDKGKAHIFVFKNKKDTRVSGRTTRNMEEVIFSYKFRSCLYAKWRLVSFHIC